MEESYILRLDQAVRLLFEVAGIGSKAVMSYHREGKWYLANVILSGVSAQELSVEFEGGREKEHPIFFINEPVGISLNFEGTKYIFGTHLTRAARGVSYAKSNKFALAIPERIISIQRRYCSRVSIPQDLKVNVMFWHCGYEEAELKAPAIDYWQGKLLDLSAGGLLMTVNEDVSTYLRLKQYVGLNFTPTSYKEPIVLEGRLNRLVDRPRQKALELAVEFLGLEATDEGRGKLLRLVSAVSKYSQSNKIARSVEGGSFVEKKAAEFLKDNVADDDVKDLV
jgi:c-di-GMP-binding flagellar brake protein YcgR